MAGSKPGERRGGRKKGTPNAIPATLKEMILTALDDAGGVAYLVEQARKNPNGFMMLLGRILPLQVNATGKVTLEQLVAGAGAAANEHDKDNTG